MTDWLAILKDIEDRLAPQLALDVWERTAYYHLLRHTRMEGKEVALFSIGPLSKILPLSDFKVREVLRSLDRKGCTKNQVTRRGYQVAVYLPDEIGTLTRDVPEERHINIEEIDFFSGRTYLLPLLKRENNRCFFCLAKITTDNCELDHLVPKAMVEDNSYRNIVAACHSCNRKKLDQSAENYLRSLYRSGLLGEKELQVRLQAVEKLKSGEMVPEI